MKNLFTSKKFIISALSVACIGILAACLYVNRGQKNDFTPEETAPTTSNQEWQETAPPTSGLAEKPSTAAIPKETEPAEEYPQVAEENVEESSTEVVIDFTPPTSAPKETPKETTPPAPEGKTIIEDPGPEHPVNPAPEVTAPPAETPASTEPVPGSGNGDGAVYDPVFGWVVPGEVQQSTISSDGDPNKMVGNMGE